MDNQILERAIDGIVKVTGALKGLQEEINKLETRIAELEEENKELGESNGELQEQLERSRG